MAAPSLGAKRRQREAMIAAIRPLAHIPSRRVEEKIYFNSPHNKAGGNQRDVTHICSGGSYLDRISESGIERF